MTSIYDLKLEKQSYTDLLFALCSDVRSVYGGDWYYFQPRCEKFLPIIKYVLDRYALLAPDYYYTNRYSYNPDCKIVRVCGKLLDSETGLKNVDEIRAQIRQGLKSRAWVGAKTFSMHGVPGKFFVVLPRFAKDDIVSKLAYKFSGVTKTR